MFIVHLIRVRVSLWIILIFFILYLPVIPLFSANTASERGRHLPSPPFSSLGGSGASLLDEEEGTDSMNVHPVNRWTCEESSYSVHMVESGHFKMSDTEDSTPDYYRITRELQSLDDSIYVRFKVDSTTASTTTEYDTFSVALGGIGWGKPIFFSVQYIRSTSTDTKIYYYDVVNTQRTLDIAEDIEPDIWYTLRIDYDVLQSYLRFRVYHDNGTRFSDYTWQDIGSQSPGLFMEEYLEIRIQSGSYYSGNIRTDYVSYVEAPFKEHEWTQSGSPPSATNWTASNPFNTVCYGPADDSDEWHLTVPYLDSLSGTLSGSYVPDFANNDYGYAELYIAGVDANDGGMHDIVRFKLKISKEYSGTDWPIYSSCEVYDGDGTLLYDVSTEICEPFSSESRDDTKLLFNAYLRDERSVLTLELRWIPEAMNATAEDRYFELEVSDFVDDPSTEFVIKHYYRMYFQSSIAQGISFVYEDYAFLRQDLWSDLAQPLVEGIGNFVVGLFMLLFGWLIGILKIVMDLVGAFIVAGIGVALGLVEGAIDALAPLLDGITTAVAAVAAAIWDLLEPVLSDIIGWLIGLANYLFELIAAIVFWVWDALGLPDLWPFLIGLLQGLFNLLQGCPNYLLIGLGSFKPSITY